jgi:hypothetical protein
MTNVQLKATNHIIIADKLELVNVIHLTIIRGNVPGDIGNVNHRWLTIEELAGKRLCR